MGALFDDATVIEDDDEVGGQLQSHLVARALRDVSILIRLDLPALRLPKKAICSRSALTVSFRPIA